MSAVEVPEGRTVVAAVDPFDPGVVWLHTAGGTVQDLTAAEAETLANELREHTAQVLPSADNIARAIGDPGSVVGNRIHTSFGDDHDETITRWATRAVLALLAGAR